MGSGEKYPDFIHGFLVLKLLFTPFMASWSWGVMLVLDTFTQQVCFFVLAVLAVLDTHLQALMFSINSCCVSPLNIIIFDLALN